MSSETVAKISGQYELKLAAVQEQLKHVQVANAGLLESVARLKKQLGELITKNRELSKR